MGVSDSHSEFDSAKQLWKRIRDCCEGQDAVHKAGQEYLPRLSGQSDEEYKAYVKRAMFYGATSRTVDGLTGMVFRKPATIEMPKSLEPYIDDITLEGMSLHGFAEEVIDEGVKVGRAGILVDFPSAENLGNIVTVAQAEENNIRPFFKLYKAEAIFNWKVGSVNNAKVLTEVRLYESVDTATAEFEVDYVDQIRVLDISPFGVYRQRLYRMDADRKWQQFGEDIIPTVNGKALSYIPFVFVGVKSNSPSIDKPLLIDLANVNISHYLTTADLEHGAHYTALPTAVIAGNVVTDDDEPEYKIGSANAWVFPSPDTKAFFLEFQGQGLDSLSKRLTQKEEYMAFLGAKMLAPDKRGVEATDTARLYRQGENSVLASLSKAVSASIEEALGILAEWVGVAEEIKFSLNTDFLPTSMTPQEMVALMQLWQSGGIAFEDLLDNLKRGEIVSMERTAEDINGENEEHNPFLDQMKASIADVGNTNG